MGDNNKVFFVRVPAELYNAIQDVAKEQGRTIQMQTQILLGAALNRGLVNPGEVIAEKKSSPKARGGDSLPGSI